MCWKLGRYILNNTAKKIITSYEFLVTVIKTLNLILFLHYTNLCAFKRKLNLSWKNKQWKLKLFYLQKLQNTETLNLYDDLLKLKLKMTNIQIRTITYE